MSADATVIPFMSREYTQGKAAGLLERAEEVRTLEDALGRERAERLHLHQRLVLVEAERDGMDRAGKGALASLRWALSFVSDRKPLTLREAVAVTIEHCARAEWARDHARERYGRIEQSHREQAATIERVQHIVEGVIV